MTLKQLLPEGPFVLVGAIGVIYILAHNLGVIIPLAIFGGVGYYAGFKLYKKLHPSDKPSTITPTAQS